MNTNSITFRAWEKGTYLPICTGNKTNFSIEALNRTKKYNCSFKNGILKATKNGKDVFVKETTPEDFSKDIITMHKTLLPDDYTFDELLDRLSLEG